MNTSLFELPLHPKTRQDVSVACHRSSTDAQHFPIYLSVDQQKRAGSTAFLSNGREAEFLLLGEMEGNGEQLRIVEPRWRHCPRNSHRIFS